MTEHDFKEEERRCGLRPHLLSSFQVSGQIVIPNGVKRNEESLINKENLFLLYQLAQLSEYLSLSSNYFAFNSLF